MNRSSITSLLFAVLSTGLLATLAACGGGGGGDPAPAAGNAPAGNGNRMVTAPPAVEGPADGVDLPASGNNNLITQVPASGLTAGSEEHSAFLLLNRERGRCGFGLLAQNTPLDAAARAHADYQIINSLASHYEDKVAFPLGFTGVFVSDRALAQGYAGAGGLADEFSLFTTSDPAQTKTGFGELGIRSLLNAPYHLSALVGGYRDVGIAVRSNADTGRGGRGIYVQLDLGYKLSAGKQALGAADVATYPCDGATDIVRQLTAESPSPVPGRNLVTSPLGSSVYIALREGNILTISTATMNRIADGKAVTLRTPVTSANDPYAPCASGCYKSHEGYVAADAPLDANTSYRVSISGTNNSVFFTRSFTFTTAR